MLCRLMSQEQLSAFLEAVKADAGLEEKLKAAGDLGAAVAIAVEAGFDVSMADWLKAQARQVLEMSDEELAGVAGGNAATAIAAGLAKSDRIGLTSEYDPNFNVVTWLPGDRQ